MKIAFVGDIFLGGDLYGKNAPPPGNLDEFLSADIRIGNLESPLSDTDSYADKSTLYSDRSSVRNLSLLKITAVNLANNHLHDKTDQGIIETLATLEENDIGHFGAGMNLEEARKPYWITDDLCIIGYCDFGRSYLSKVQVATEDQPGVNPLRYSSLKEDLDRLPEGTKVILYFHWGREHVLFPPYRDISLAKQLLSDSRVATIIGTHCHRIQGRIIWNNKCAYMSLGNFLFPNFFISPPNRIHHPKTSPRRFPVTKQYHKVFVTTYKKWNEQSRTSLLVVYDTLTKGISHVPVYQDSERPQLRGLNGIQKALVRTNISLLTIVYQTPSFLYGPIEKANQTVLFVFWNLRNFQFYSRQHGFAWSFRYYTSFLRQKNKRHVND